MARNIFNEIVEGLHELKLYEQGKITLKTIERELPDNSPLEITPAEVKSIRENLNLSQAVFAHRLRTSVRTY